MIALAADTGFTFADTFPIGLLFVGIAVFAAVGAMSHEHERAFSASLIYLGLGAIAALAIQLIGIDWVEPLKDAEVLEPRRRGGADLRAVLLRPEARPHACAGANGARSCGCSRSPCR